MNSWLTVGFVGFLALTLAMAAPIELPAGQDPNSSGAQLTTLAPLNASEPANKDSFKIQTNFSCYNRTVGFYSNIELNCRVYHLCLIADYLGEPIYQRATYLCINETIFDQKAMSCVEESAMSISCAESETYYDSSNNLLRRMLMDAN